MKQFPVPVMEKDRAVESLAEVAHWRFTVSRAICDAVMPMLIRAGASAEQAQSVEYIASKILCEHGA